MPKRQPHRTVKPLLFFSRKQLPVLTAQRLQRYAIALMAEPDQSHSSPSLPRNDVRGFFSTNFPKNVLFQNVI